MTALICVNHIMLSACCSLPWHAALLSISYQAQVPDMETSAMRIAETVLNLPEGVVPILAAHNGPTNLGNSAWSISGVDFKPGGGGLPQGNSGLSRNNDVWQHTELCMWRHQPQPIIQQGSCLQP